MTETHILTLSAAHSNVNRFFVLLSCIAELCRWLEKHIK